PLWLYDIETRRVLDANSAACRKYGYTGEEFVALSLPVIEVHSTSGLPAPNVRSHRLRSGACMVVELSVLDVTCNGRPARCMCPQDVTPLARTLAALRQSEAA